MAPNYPALILDSEEIRRITGLKRHKAQAQALARMGINYRIRPDGAPIVSRAHFEAIMAGHTGTPSLAATEPNWSALDAA
jgi:hypothetical protein